METLLHSTSMISAAMVGALFAAIWQGAILAAAVALCLRAMPRLSAAARSIVWLNVFLVLVLLHALPALWRASSSATVAHIAPVHLDPRWSLALAAVWAMLSLWKAAQLAVSAVRLHHLASRATPVSTGPAVEALFGLNGGRRAQLCTSTEVERPSVCGFFRPRILFPPALLEILSADEVRQVVVHEMEHLNRGDDWTNLVQKLALVLFPLNPAIVWVERRLCHERELACDDRVLRSCCGRKAYAVCLTRLAEYTLLHRGLTLVLGAWERRPELVRRVHRILRRPSDSLSPRAAMAVTGGLSAIILLLAAALAHSPQLVSFTPLADTTAQTHSLSASGLQLVNLTASADMPRPQLIKAVMPQASNPSSTPPKTRRITAHGRSVKPKPPLNLQAQQAQQAWVVLTDWDSELPAPRFVIAVDQLNRPSFAAVQFANGWLIVQI
jgi:beta-lactamase regulating signal transducer with metallopeptidase domain